MPTDPARSHRRAGGRVTLVTVVVLGLLTSCAPAPSPSPPPPTSTGPTATPSSSLPAPAPSPTPPPEMTRDDEAGAVAAVDHFLALYAYTESTRDTAPWQAISHPDCVFCHSVLDDIAKRRAEGRVVRAHPMNVTARNVKSLNPLAYEVAVTVTKEPDELWSSDGRLIDPGNDLGGRLDVIVVFQVDRWLVRAVSTSDAVSR